MQNCQEAAAIIDHCQAGVEGGGGMHGVMIGRQAFYQTWDCLADADRSVFGASANPALSRRQVVAGGLLKFTCIKPEMLCSACLLPECFASIAVDDKQCIEPPFA